MAQFALLDPRSLNFAAHTHNQVVKKSHKMIKSANKESMSLNEQRLLAYALSKLPACEPEALQGSDLVVTVSGIEFGEAFGMCSAQRYRDLYDAFDGLAGHFIEWEIPAKGRRKARRAWAPIIVVGTRPQDKSEQLREGYVELKFNEAIIDGLLVKRHFILYRLGETCVLTRSLSFRLYDLGREMLPFDANDIGSRGRRWELDEFRHLLGMSDVYTDSYADLSKNALRPAVDEINTRTFGLHLTYAPVKRGRRTVGIQWIARRKRPEEMEEVRAWRAEHGLANHLGELQPEPRKRAPALPKVA